MMPENMRVIEIKQINALWELFSRSIERATRLEGVLDAAIGTEDADYVKGTLAYEMMQLRTLLFAGAYLCDNYSEDQP